MMFSKSIVTCIIAALIAGPACAEPSEAVKTYRLHMMESPFRMMANRTIKDVFNTLPVKAGPLVAELPTKLAPLDFRYKFEGRDYLATDILEKTGTDALLIIKDGTIVYEGYFNNASDQTMFNSYSVSKSINAIMIEFALQDGDIKSLKEDVTVYLPELEGSGYDGVTIQQLIDMRSGVAFPGDLFTVGSDQYVAHVSSWVEENARYTDFARDLALEHRPGTIWRYNNMDAAVAGLLVSRATRTPLSQYVTEKLWHPAGMEGDGFYVIDGPPGVGHEFSVGGFSARLRDYGRIGLFMLSRGTANGRRLLSEERVAVMQQRLPFEEGASELLESKETFDGYGSLWWHVAGTQAFSAVGGGGQFVYVDPQSRTVIVKLSHALDPMTSETLAFFKAASAWPGM